MADYINTIDMGVFVYDYDHNAPTVEHLANTHKPFFDRIRQAHPDIPILMMEDLESYCKSHTVDIAALTIPKSKAVMVAKQIVDLGIKAVWNFTNVDLKVASKDVIVESVHLSDSLMQLSYNIVKNS